MVIESNSNNASRAPIRCMRGDSFERILRFWQDDAKTIPEDITANTYKAEVRKNDFTDPVLIFDMTNGGFTFSGVQDLLMVKTHLQMAVPLPGSYTYDVEETLPDGSVNTIIKDVFIIDNDETR